jgi:hypothetical protein
MRGLKRFTFFITFLLLSWVWIRVSHGDEEDTEYNESDMRVFSVLLSSTRNHHRGWCRRPNPDDPGGEILKGVHCPIRLNIMDRNNPVRECAGVLIGKHRATDGDLTF